METISSGPTVRRLDADQVYRAPIPTTKSLPVLFANMGQPYPAWMRATFRRRTTTKVSPLDAGVVCGAIAELSFAQSVSNGYTLRMKDSRLRIRVQCDFRERFIAVCQAQDNPAAQVLREFMRLYVAENEREPHDIKPQLGSSPKRVENL